MFKKRYTNWTPLGSFDFQGKDYITFIRKSKKDGMIHFKTKRVNKPFGVNNCVNNVIFKNLIDTEKAWSKVVNE